MIGHCPDQLELPFALWAREAVRDLVRARFGVRLALRTVSDYLRRRGFTPQRPIKRARWNGRMPRSRPGWPSTTPRSRPAPKPKGL